VRRRSIVFLTIFLIGVGLLERASLPPKHPSTHVFRLQDAYPDGIERRLVFLPEISEPWYRTTLRDLGFVRRSSTPSKYRFVNGRLEYISSEKRADVAH
jgi:hypothetical protein